MLSFLLARFLQAVPVLLIASFLVFIGMRLSPGDPALMVLGSDATPEMVAAVRESMGLNDGYLLQYIYWLGAFLTGDFGRSLVSGLPVTAILAERIWPTLELAIAGLLASIVVGGLIGTLSGLRPGTFVDRLMTAVSALGLSAPMFWTGMLLIMIFGVTLGWLPVSGRVSFAESPIQALASLALPVATLSLANAPIIARFLRDSILETRRADFVRTARAKGLPPRTIARNYILRNSLVSTVTAAGILMGNLIGGAALVEIVFSWPGLGSLLVSAMGNRDYSVIQAVMLISVVGFLFANLVVDILYVWLNPKLRYGR